ncbi:hypothetical protein AVEN_228152-1 [Araneus ventricosus]|uniref:DDE-1 domain-containing protein n=1 Tax=Araneus ventricosus TaxID=182803 RepID=A0A4Y2CU91_ARAVE|nr:hypothetical protein AVEN_228152-1 [Araneus ventricosus]
MHNNTPVSVDFGYIGFALRRLTRISPACLFFAANFAKTNAEVPSSEKSEAQKFESESKYYVEAGGFSPQQVFNCDETGLFWKKIPNRAFIT